MKLPIDERFHREVAQHRVALYCEECVLFDAARGCAHGYPTEPHRKPTANEVREWVFFCKDFEATGQDDER